MTVMKKEIPPLPSSTICLHKGSLNSVMSLGASSPLGSVLFLGKVAWNSKLHVCHMVLSTLPIAEVLGHERVRAKCAALSLKACGALMRGTYEGWRATEQQRSVFSLFDSVDKPLLVVVDYSTEPTGKLFSWEFQSEHDTAVACSISHVTQPHDHAKRMNYNVVWLDDLGASHIETATRHICKSLMFHVKQEVVSQAHQFVILIFGSRTFFSSLLDCLSPYVYIYIIRWFMYMYPYIYIGF